MAQRHQVYTNTAGHRLMVLTIKPHARAYDGEWFTLVQAHNFTTGDNESYREPVFDAEHRIAERHEGETACHHSN